MRLPAASPQYLACDTFLDKILGLVFRLLGIRRSARNPNICTRCDQIVDTFLTMVSQQIVRCGGFVDKYIGDAVMAFFNVPIRHEDHARRAIGAAIVIQQGLARSGEVLVSQQAFQSIAAELPDIQPERLTAKDFDRPIDVFRLGKPDQSHAAVEAGRDELVIARRVGIGSILFTILGMPCVVVTTASPVAVVLGAGGLFGAITPVFGLLDHAAVRIPLQLLAALGAAAYLYLHMSYVTP